MVHIYGEVPNTNKKYNVILATGLQEVELKAPITEEYVELAKSNKIDYTLPDTDEDGLPDYAEINFSIKDTDGKPLIQIENGVVDLPTYGECVALKAELTYVEQGLNKYKDNDITPYSEVYSFDVLPIISVPTDVDGDGDDLLDDEEWLFDASPLDSDTDNDKLSDGLEAELWYNPTNTNPDEDSFTDYEEWINNTSPYVYNMTVQEAQNAFLEGALLGDWTTADSIEKLLGQIAFSFVPFAADARDYFANIFVNIDSWSALANLGGFLLDLTPAGAAGDAAKAVSKLGRFVAKYSDDAPKVIEAIVQASKIFPKADGVVPELVKIFPVGTVENIANSVKNCERITKADYDTFLIIYESAGKNADELIEVTKFKSFKALKEYLGDPGKDKQWHHLVEQCQVKKTRSGFKVEDINTVSNVRATPKDVHKDISAFYSSKQPFTNGKTVRDWLNGQSYEAQYKFGIEQWEKFMKQHGYSI